MDGSSQRPSLSLVAGVLSASAVLAVLVGALVLGGLPEPSPAGGGSVPAWGIVFKVLAAPLVSAWCYSACRRCTDRFVQRCLVGICVLCLFWILDTLLKYPARDDDLVRALWYLFYIPIIYIPLLCSYLALHLARGGTERTLARFRAIAFAVSTALLAMVLSNGLHHLVFVIDYEDPQWGSAYGYGPGYLLVVLWVVALVATCPAALLYAARRSLRRAIAFLLVPLALIGAYALCYALRVPVVFSSSVAMMYTIFIVATFEAALQLGLVPVQRRQREVFARLPFELAVYDEQGSLCYRTDEAARNSGPGSDDSHRRREVVPLSSGYVVAIKDTALIDERSDELDAMRGCLERQHVLLESEYGVDANVRVQQELEALYDEVAGSVSRGIRRACALLDTLPAEGGVPDGRGEQAVRGPRWSALAEVKLLLGLCKQKGQCVVDARGRGEFAGDYLRLAMAEACANMRPLGIECAVLVEAESLSARELLVLLDELYAWGIAVLGDAPSTIVSRVGKDATGGRPRLRMMIECTSASAVRFRRKALARNFGETLSETVLPLEETSLSVSVPLSLRGGMR